MYSVGQYVLAAQITISKAKTMIPPKFPISLFPRAHVIARLGIATLFVSLSTLVRADPPNTAPAPPPTGTPAPPPTGTPAKLSRADLTTATFQIPVYGAAYAWGNNGNGQLANGSRGGVYYAPVTIDNSADNQYVNGGVTAIGAGDSFSIAIQSGAVYAWGSNASGCLGNNSPGNDSYLPVAVASPLDGGVSAVSAGSVHSLAIKGGVAYGWGNNGYGQVGSSLTTAQAPFIAVPTPVQSPLNSNVSAVAAGESHSLAIRKGAVYAWGSNDFYQLGNPISGRTNTPQPVNALSAYVTAIAAGGTHSLAIQNNAGKATAYSWGENAYGALGDSTRNSTDPTPAKVPSLETDVTSVAAGFRFSLAVKDGMVYAWGYNGYGELGNGTMDSDAHPTATAVDPTEMNNIVAVAAGSRSSYALAADGSLWVWGDNSDGQLGIDKVATVYTTPQHLMPPSGFYYVAVSSGSGSQHALAIQFAPPSTFFNGETYVGDGTFYLSFPNGNYFGYYSFLPNARYVFHQDLGFEYVFDAADGRNGVYLYDFASATNTTNGTFFYTSPDYPFPYMYDFTLNSVVYYYPDTNNPGHYTTNPRYFYNFATKAIITK